MQPDPEPGIDADPDFPSGEWTGFFIQSETRYRQDLTITFRAGRMSGDGIDFVDPFSVQGHYNRKSREVWWVKSYPTSAEVHYRGYRDTKGIWGTWEIDPGCRGGFHIWPRSEGENLARRASVAKEAPSDTSSD